MIEDDLLQYLLNQGEIAVLTGNRIRPGALLHGDANQASIRMAMVSSPSVHDLGGPSGIVGKRIQLDCYSPEYGESKDLAEKVRLAMYGFTGPHGDENVRAVTLENQTDSTEKTEDGSDDFRFRVRQDWLVWHTEAVPA